MLIKKCEMNDLADIGEFYDNVVWDLTQSINYPKWTYKEYPSIKSAETAISNGNQYACIKDGVIVGAYILDTDPYGDYSAGEWTRNLKTGEYMIIHAFAVSTKMSGSGIGTAMVRHCAETAKSLGCKAVRIDVVPDNIPARRLYEKNGFTFAGEKDLGRNISDIPRFALYELNF